MIRLQRALSLAASCSQPLADPQSNTKSLHFRVTTPLLGLGWLVQEFCQPFVLCWSQLSSILGSVFGSALSDYAPTLLFWPDFALSAALSLSIVESGLSTGVVDQAATPCNAVTGPSEPSPSPPTRRHGQRRRRPPATSFSQLVPQSSHRKKRPSSSSWFGGRIARIMFSSWSSSSPDLWRYGHFGHDHKRRSGSRFARVSKQSRGSLRKSVPDRVDSPMMGMAPSPPGSPWVEVSNGRETWAYRPDHASSSTHFIPPSPSTVVSSPRQVSYAAASTASLGSRHVAMASPMTSPASSPRFAPVYSNHHGYNRSGPTVDVIVGEERALFLVESHVLAKAPGIPRHSNPIHLQEEDPEVFGCVLEFLQRGDYEDGVEATHDGYGYERMRRRPSTNNAIRTTVLPDNNTILRDAAVYCAAAVYRLPSLQRLALSKIEDLEQINAPMVLRSLLYAHRYPQKEFYSLQAHLASMIVRNRDVFRQDPSMRVGMGSAFFDLFGLMCNEIDARYRN